MKRLAFFALALASPAWCVDPLVNSVTCQNSSTCSTPWQVKTGNLIVWYSWGATLGGTVTDSQGNAYTQLRNVSTYHSNDRLFVALAGAPGAITLTSTVVEPNIVIAEFSGTMPLLDFPGLSYGTGGDHALCPPSAPFSLAADTDVLVLSTWVSDGQRASSCTASSGQTVGTPTCPPLGGLSGMLNYQYGRPDGTYTQQFTFAPGFNAGNGNCGIYALKSMPAAPIVTTFTAAPATVDSGKPSTLHWETTGAASVSIDHGIGTVTATGDFVVTPSVGTTYTLTATGPGGTATGSTSISVNAVQNGTIDRTSLIQLLGLTIGPDLQMVDTGTQLIISHPVVITSHCLPQPSALQWVIPQSQHARTDDGIAVTVYDDQSPRNAIQAAWTLDPTSLAVTVSFAQPQSGCVVIR